MLLKWWRTRKNKKKLLSATIWKGLFLHPGAASLRLCGLQKHDMVFVPAGRRWSLPLRSRHLWRHLRPLRLRSHSCSPLAARMSALRSLRQLKPMWPWGIQRVVQTQNQIRSKCRMVLVAFCLGASNVAPQELRSPVVAATTDADWFWYAKIWRCSGHEPGNMDVLAFWTLNSGPCSCLMVSKTFSWFFLLPNYIDALWPLTLFELNQ